MQEPGNLIKFYITSQQWFTKILILFQSVFTGLWLGLLDRKALHKYDQFYYDKINTYQNDIYNLSGLFEWEKTCLDKYFNNVKKILLIGAGGGREVIALHNLEYEVEAYECNPRLVECANELLSRRNVPVRVSINDRDASPQTAEFVDGIICGWAMYMLIQSRKSRVAFLKGLRNQCKTGAPILLSFFSRTNDSFHYRFILLIGNILRCLLRRERIEIGDDLQPNFVHFFTEQEIASELNEGGFDFVYYCTNEYGHAVGLAR